VKYFTSLYRTSWPYLSRFRFFIFCGDDDYHDNDKVLFTLLDSTCSIATPETSLGS